MKNYIEGIVGIIGIFIYCHLFVYGLFLIVIGILAFAFFSIEPILFILQDWYWFRFIEAVVTIMFIGMLTGMLTSDI